MADGEGGARRAATAAIAGAIPAMMIGGVPPAVGASPVSSMSANLVSSTRSAWADAAFHQSLSAAERTSLTSGCNSANSKHKYGRVKAYAKTLNKISGASVRMYEPDAHLKISSTFSTGFVNDEYWVTLPTNAQHTSQWLEAGAKLGDLSSIFNSGYGFFLARSTTLGYHAWWFSHIPSGNQISAKSIIKMQISHTTTQSQWHIDAYQYSPGLTLKHSAHNTIHGALAGNANNVNAGVETTCWNNGTSLKANAYVTGGPAGGNNESLELKSGGSWKYPTSAKERFSFQRSTPCRANWTSKYFKVSAGEAYL